MDHLKHKGNVKNRT